MAPDSHNYMISGTFKVIIAGGRDFKDYDFLSEKLNQLFKNRTDIEIVSGMADGADTLGCMYAEDNALFLAQFPVTKQQWVKFGKVAGPMRNERMASYANALVAFWDRKSRGTKDMIEAAKRYNLEIRIFNY